MGGGNNLSKDWSQNDDHNKVAIDLRVPGWEIGGRRERTLLFHTSLEASVLKTPVVHDRSKGF